MARAPEMEKEAEERLLIEAAQEDPRQFGPLYELHFDRIYAYIVRRVRDRSQAQDLTSQVFHDALQNIKRFEWRGAPFAAWLFRIAANAVATHCQRELQERAPIPEHYSAAVDVEEVERRARVFRLVRRLPEDQRRVLQMRFVSQKSIREIAMELQRSEGSIKQLQFRGIQTLRAWMGEDDG